MVIPLMPLKVTAYGLSDIGLVRQNNEDTWMELPAEKFFVLADGMGGHQAGEVAAKEAVLAVCQSFKKSFPKESQGLINLLEARSLIYNAMEYANSVVYKMGRTNERLKGMGTTLCCLYFHEQGLVYGHVGDSRIYVHRDTTLTQLTQDHSLLRELVDLGQLNEQQASEFLYKNIITKAIGTEPIIDPTVKISDIKKSDRFLMCSDGLSDLLTLKEMETLLNQTEDNQKAIKKLVSLAKSKGGHDNITVVLIEVS
jgi:protein phosphatase